MAPERLRAAKLGAIIALVALPLQLSAQETELPVAGTLVESPAAAPQEPAPPPAAPQDPAAVRARLATVLDGALVDTQNGDNIMVETAGYRRLLQIVAAVPAEEASKRASRTLDYGAAMKDPDSLRGEWVRVQGLFVGVRAERLDQPIDGHVDVWQGSVSNGEDQGIVFDMLERPEGLEVHHDVVDVEGVFYRTARYENRAGQMVEGPYIIARNIVRVDTSGIPVAGLAGGPFVAILIGAAVIFLVVRVATMSRTRQKAGLSAEASRAIRQAADKQLREARAAQKSAGPSQPPVPPDPPAKAS